MPLFLACLLLFAPPLSDAQIKALLPSLLEPGKRYANIDPPDGQYLHDLALKLNAKRVLEVGTSTCYSALWMGMALRKTGGRIITLEIHEPRHAVARENIARAGLEAVIDARLGDAVEIVPKLEGPFDLVFLDAGKNDYLFYFEQLLPKLRSGGVIAAHNVKSHQSDLSAYLARVKSDPRVRTEFFTGSPQGLALTYKK